MKNLKYLLFIIPFLFLSNVKAEEINFDYLDYNDFVSTPGAGIYSFESYGENYKKFPYYTDNLIDNLISKLVTKWDKDYKSTYPYYFITIISYPKEKWEQYENTSTKVYLTYFKAIPSNYNSFISLVNENYSNNVKSLYISQNSEGVVIEGEDTAGFGSINTMFYQDENFIKYLPTFYYDSNFDLPFGLEDIYNVKKGDEVLFTLNKQDIIPTFKSKFINKTDLNYTEIDLNNYPYVALSLKDYSKTEEFNSMTYVKGQYCLTSVYNYGLTERKDILSGTQMQRCSLYYDDYTPIRTYILKSDLENHSIYYLKAYDTSKENKIKVDTSVFNIHYITEEEKNNPIITINGKKYSTIPYNELTDTATKSEDENYNSGNSCAVGDINCTASLTNGSIKWSDIFTSPLDFLKNIWTSITQVFTLIAYFIALLPTTLQYFFYISFTLAIVLGIIKIIL